MQDLLVDPDVAVFFKDDGVEGLLKEALEDCLTLLLAELVDVVTDLRVLDRGRLQLVKDILDEAINASATVRLDIKCTASHSLNKQVEDSLDQVAFKLREKQLQVVTEEVQYDLVGRLMDFLVGC